MKVKLFSLFLVLSVLFLSCSNGVSEKGEGTISVDAGKLAELMTANSARSASRASLARSGDGDFYDYMSYTLKVKLSTEGGYSTSTEKQFKKSLSAAYFMRSEEEWAAMDETDLPEYDLIKEAKGTPITLSGVPIGRKIKVKAVLTFGYTFDMNGYLDSLRAYGYTDEMIETAKLYAELDIADYEGEDDFSVEGISDEFVVQAGENTVKITIRDLSIGESGSGSGSGGGNNGNGQSAEPIDVPIILYSKIQQIPEGQKTEIYVSENGTKTLLVDETEGFINSCIDNNGYVYILYMKFTEMYDTKCYFVYSNNPNFPDEDVWLSTNSEEEERIAYDSVENKIYTYCKKTGNAEPYNDNLIIRCYPNLINDGSTSGAVEYVCEGFFNYFNTAGLFAVNNQTAYVARMTMDSYNRVNSLPVYEFDLSQGINLSLDDAEEIFDLYDDANWSYINDTYYADGYLYMLVADKMEKFGNNDHYGGLVRLNIQDKEAETFLSPESYDIQAYSEDGDGGYYTITLNQPTAIGSKAAFFCPRKIIGIKPKRLIIADDGFFVYKDEDDDDKPHFTNVNRVVMVNLEKYPIEINRVDVMTDVNFSGDETSLTCGATGFEGSDTVICDD